MSELTELTYDMFRIGYAGARYPNSIKAIQIFLNPELASTVNTPFYIGRNRVVFYGNPIVMMTNSSLVAESGSDILEGQVHFASSNIIYEREGPSLLWVILYINSMLTDKMILWSRSEMRVLFTLLESFYILKWCDYFGVDQESFLYKTIRNNAFEGIFSIVYGHTKRQFTSDEITFIERLYPQYRSKCITRQKRGVCERFEQIVLALQVNLYKQDREAWMIMNTWNQNSDFSLEDVIYDWLANPFELSPAGKQAMNTALKEVFWTIRPYNPVGLIELAEDVGYDITPMEKEVMRREPMASREYIINNLLDKSHPLITGTSLV